MTDRERTRISKFLSKHLRHTPAAIGLTLQNGAWIDVEELLAACSAAGVKICRAELDEVVLSNDKQRFAFDETGTRIRANQGHSIDVDLQLAPADPPPLLYHGTADRNLEAILRLGLLKMRRHHVHLSADRETAMRVGARYGRPVILIVDAGQMLQAGAVFYRSANGVWLVDNVPPKFLRMADEHVS